MKRSRITPACAGNSPEDFPLPPSTWDHPRVCGEQIHALILWAGIWGSPPRVRGTAVQDGENAVLTRITPACAGNR